MTKDEIRCEVRRRLTLAGVACFPGIAAPVPNFVGADRAARLLYELPVWKRAKVVKINSDPPQYSIRRAALEQGKLVYVALPRLHRERCFIELDPAKLGTRIGRTASLLGALRLGRLLAPCDMHSVDAVVCGSLAVTLHGARLGPGGGYEDLAYALLRSEGKIRESTPIITTVHPLQIVAERLPMRGHDLPVDFLITPDKVVAAPNLHLRPRGILWGILPDEKILAVPLLRQGRHRARSIPAPHRL
jgi:5-formyltetrahydrofolate cyclo-ligase